MRQWLNPVSDDTEVVDDRSMQEQEKLAYLVLLLRCLRSQNLHQGDDYSANNEKYCHDRGHT